MLKTKLATNTFHQKAYFRSKSLRSNERKLFSPSIPKKYITTTAWWLVAQAIQNWHLILQLNARIDK